MPIKNYGLDWGWDMSLRRYGLWGQHGSSEPVNFDSQIGIYVLKKGMRIVYVGKTSRPGFGLISCLYRHHRNKAGKWNKFCWFGMRGVDSTKAELVKLETQYTKVAEEIRDIESILIYLLDPKLNSAPGAYKHLAYYEQYWD